MLRTLRWLLAAMALSGCATLNTASMSPACRDAYNLCLDGCPQPPAGHSTRDMDTTTPACVEDCNRNARSCT